jgi:hypothetical protein
MRVLPHTCPVRATPAPLLKEGAVSAQDFSSGIYQLAARCEVGIGEACDRAGISRSTPPRWRQGHQPREVQLVRLRRAIMELARDRGTLPVDLADQVQAPTPLQRARRLVAEAQALEADLSAGEPGK